MRRDREKGGQVKARESFAGQNMGNVQGPMMACTLAPLYISKLLANNFMIKTTCQRLRLLSHDHGLYRPPA